MLFQPVQASHLILTVPKPLGPAQVRLFGERAALGTAALGRRSTSSILSLRASRATRPKRLRSPRRSNRRSSCRHARRRSMSGVGAGSRALIRPFPCSLGGSTPCLKIESGGAPRSPAEGVWRCRVGRRRVLGRSWRTTRDRRDIGQNEEGVGPSGEIGGKGSDGGDHPAVFISQEHCPSWKDIYESSKSGQCVFSIIILSSKYQTYASSQCFCRAHCPRYIAQVWLECPAASPGSWETRTSSSSS